MREILRKVHVNCPFQDLFHKHLEKFLEWGINPEIGFNCAALDDFTEADFIAVAAKIRSAGLRVTMHAPFMDLRPGAVDPMIRRISEDRIRQAVAAAAIFRPVNIVGHPSFDKRYYVSNEDAWLANSVQTWGKVIDDADGTVICLENVYDTGPQQIKALLDSLGSPKAGFCFDTGHYNVFSEAPLREWIEELGGYIKEVHLHDNFGRTDDHLPVGEGNFPFHELFTMLKKIEKKPVITLEPHNEDHLWKTLGNIERMNLLGDFE